MRPYDGCYRVIEKAPEEFGKKAVKRLKRVKRFISLLLSPMFHAREMNLADIIDGVGYYNRNMTGIAESRYLELLPDVTRSPETAIITQRHNCDLIPTTHMHVHT